MQASAVVAPQLSRTGSVVVAHRLSCSTACGIFPDQGSNPCLLHWWADSLPLNQQRSPHDGFSCLMKKGSIQTTVARFLHFTDHKCFRTNLYRPTELPTFYLAKKRGYYEIRQKKHYLFSLSKVKVSQSCLTLCDPMDCPWNSPSQNTGMGSLSLLQGSFPTQGSNPGLPHCRWVLYQLRPQGKPKNTGVDSLSLLQGIFPTQELNQGLPHCRRILYQLNYQGSQK